MPLVGISFSENFSLGIPKQTLLPRAWLPRVCDRDPIRAALQLRLKVVTVDRGIFPWRTSVESGRGGAC